jgi:hypothetical protein
MAARLGLGEPVHLLPPANSKAGNQSALSDEPDNEWLNVFRHGAEKYAVVAALVLACIGMTTWLVLLALVLLRAVEWTLG